MPPELHGLPRGITDEVMRLLENPWVLTLTGVRRSGKSTILLQVAHRLLASGVPPSNVLMANFEDPALTGATVGDLMAAHRQEHSPTGRVYVLLDEVQRSPGWERWLYIDLEQKRDVRYVVTGSSSAVHRGELATVLTGRAWEVKVWPLSFPEFLAFRGGAQVGLVGDERRDAMLHALSQYIELGGFPEVTLRGPVLARGLLRQYFDAILYRDVVLRHRVDATGLSEFATYIMSNVGTSQSLRSMAEATGLTPDAVKRYLGYLEEAFLVHPVPALTFKTRPLARERFRTKYYSVDTGLRNAVVERHSPDLGRLVESVVCQELVRAGGRPRHWRGRREVDFVLGTRPGPLTPVNVCYSDAPPPREREGLEEFMASVRGPKGRPLVLTRSVASSSETVESVPVWRWLLEAGGPGRPPSAGTGGM